MIILAVEPLELAGFLFTGERQRILSLS